ncbi:MAG: trypsin-like peptidase domain-containing protein [Gemmatimonadota bacterium]
MKSRASRLALSQASRLAGGELGSARAWVVALLLAAFPIGLALGGVLSPSADAPGQAEAARSDTPNLIRTSAADAGVESPQQRPLAQQAEPARQQAPPEGSARYTPIVRAANRVSPSVVSVTVLRTVSESRRSSPFDFFVPRRFERTVRGLGSGFAINDRGHVLTNDHVVSDADSIVVTDNRGRVFQASVVGSDPLTDVALLKIPAGEIPAAPLGVSSDIMVGEPAIAIGNPFGYLLANSEATVTVGVISGVGRDFRGQDESLMADLVQTDASINPGNSGGPLVNAEGEVIGINSSIFSRSGGSEGLGFSIPIDRALRVAEELDQYGRIRRPWVGLWPSEVIVDDRIPQTAVRRVADSSPADRAGLVAGDLLISLNDRPVDSSIGWELGLLDAGVNSQVRVTYERGGRRRSVTLDVEELPSNMAERVQVVRGLELITLTPSIALERRLDIERGALISEIESQASDVTGLREGDVLLFINREPVSDAQTAGELFQSNAGRGRIVVEFFRDGRQYRTLFSVG